MSRYKNNIEKDHVYQRNFLPAKFASLSSGRLSTARFCNLELNRSGNFWQHESYDHVVQTEEELSRTILYILNNPVKAGLVTDGKDWKYTYFNPDLGEW